MYNGWIPPVHNIYYLWWAETGIFGLLLHLSVWFGFIWIGIKNLKVRNEFWYILNVASVAALIAYLFDGFLSFSLRTSEPLRIFFFQGAIIYVVHYFRMLENSNARRLIPRG